MAHFTTHKLLELAARTSARAEYARAAHRAAADNIYTVEHLIRPALPLAREEQSNFWDAFAEPMPAHLRHTLEAEVFLWEQLGRGLAALRAAEATEDISTEYTPRVRSYLAHTHDLLRMEEEMVTSCLVGHYDLQRDEIVRAANALNITRV
jgi:hypothetical protein